MKTAVKRACDACHRRKVRCDGVNPCRNCSSAQLSCTYNAIPQKKGPKGSRAKVISELRENQRQSCIAAKIQNRLNSPAASTLAPTPGLLTNGMIKSCMDFFFASMYPSIPILSRQRLEQDAMAPESTLDTYCLLSSLCALMMLQPGMPAPAMDPYSSEDIPGASIMTATLLLEESIRVRKSFDYMSNPSHYSLATSFFLFACHQALDMKEKAWCNIREATTIIHLVRMTKEDSYQVGDQGEAVRRRRLFWLFYAAERVYAIQYDRPLSLKSTIAIPTMADDPNDPYGSQLLTFCRLVTLFRIFDGPFVDLWNKIRADCSPVAVTTLQKQQASMIKAMARSDAQLCDVHRNKQWVQNLAWQINATKGNNCSAGNNDMATYQYSAMDISRETAPMAASFSSQGSALIESLLCVTSDLMDVLSMMPSNGGPFAVTPRDHMHQIAKILATLRVGEHRFAPLLLVKVHEVLPGLVNPTPQAASEHAPVCDIDIFDGFGNAGMVPQASYLPLEDFKTEPPPSVCGTSSMQDMQSPFVSSPPILSPGMDFSHGMGSDFAPLPDVMMQQAPGRISSLSPRSLSELSNGQHQSPAPTAQQSGQAQQHQPHPTSVHNLQHQSLARRISHHQHQSRLQLHAGRQQQSMAQQQSLPRVPQQFQHQQGQVQKHQPHRSVPMLQSLNSIQRHISEGSMPSPATNMNAVVQPLGQAQSMTDPMESQLFGGLDNLNKANCLGDGDSDERHSLGSNTVSIRPHSQRAASFAVSGPQIRTVGDFQALQRANSDINSLNHMTIADVSSGLDFNATLR